MNMVQEVEPLESKFAFFSARERRSLVTRWVPREPTLLDVVYVDLYYRKESSREITLLEGMVDFFLAHEQRRD